MIITLGFVSTRIILILALFGSSVKSLQNANIVTFDVITHNIAQANKYIGRRRVMANEEENVNSSIFRRPLV